MLLTCPACSARYEVPVSALPPEGRVVRCSNCRAEWMARPVAVQPKAPVMSPVQQARTEPTAPSAAAAPAAPSAPKPEAPSSAAAPAPRSEPSLAAPARAVAEAPDTVNFEPPTPDKAAEQPPEPKGPSPGADPAHALVLSLDGEDERSGGGFLAGFATVAVLALLAAGTYIKHAEIAAAVPSLSGVLHGYAGAVDAGRRELDRLVDRVRGEAP